MSEPTQTCKLCGRQVIVRPVGNTFPPDAAKRRLRKRCNAAGCPSKPTYTAGIAFRGPATGQGGAAHRREP